MLKETNNIWYWRQPNLINNNFMRETLFGNNLVSTSLLRELSQDNVQEKRHQKKREKEVQRLSQKLSNQNMRSLSVTSGNKRVEYFPDENIIIRGSGSTTDPLDIAEDNTENYSDEENPKEKKIVNNILDNNSI
jgi:lipid A disaccharide synthetase